MASEVHVIVVGDADGNQAIGLLRDLEAHWSRFLHDSEAQHVERAAEMGLLRQYTAWAVALGEVDRWEKAVEAAAAQPGSTLGTSRHTNFAMTAPMIARAVSTASTAPSSSGGGGGGGGAGGGGGGGGGGSW